MVTIKDLAAEAGVSVATASRVLSGARQVRESSAERVHAAAERLGYRPNGVARALRLQTSEVVGVVVPEIANPFFPRLVQAVERSLQRSGRAIMLCDSQGDPHLEANRVELLLDRRVDALVIVPSGERVTRRVLTQAARSTPVVQVDRRVEGVPSDYVTVDHRSGIGDVLAHLDRGGIRTAAFVGASSDLPAVRTRLEAYQEGMRRRDVRSAERVHLGEFSVEWGREAVDKLMADEMPDALVCANDLIAVGVLQGLRAHSLRVPADVAVTGFDDAGFATATDPALTTVRQPMEGLGRAAAELLERRMSGDRDELRTVTLQPQLIRRDSTPSTAESPIT